MEPFRCWTMFLTSMVFSEVVHHVCPALHFAGFSPQLRSPVLPIHVARIRHYTFWTAVWCSSCCCKVSGETSMHATLCFVPVKVCFTPTSITLVSFIQTKPLRALWKACDPAIWLIIISATKNWFQCTSKGLAWQSCSPVFQVSTFASSSFIQDCAKAASSNFSSNHQST